LGKGIKAPYPIMIKGKICTVRLCEKVKEKKKVAAKKAASKANYKSGGMYSTGRAITVAPGTKKEFKSNNPKTIYEEHEEHEKGIKRNACFHKNKSKKS
jgi:hypothetical protein